MITGTVAPGTHGIKVTLPADLASECENCFLLLQPYECAQRFVYDRLLRRKRSQLLRFLDQYLINNDVGSQSITSMCIVSLDNVYDQLLNSIRRNHRPSLHRRFPESKKASQAGLGLIFMTFRELFPRLGMPVLD